MTGRLESSDFIDLGDRLEGGDIPGLAWPADAEHAVGYGDRGLRPPPWPRSWPVGSRRHRPDARSTPHRQPRTPERRPPDHPSTPPGTRRAFTDRPRRAHQPVPLAPGHRLSPVVPLRHPRRRAPPSTTAGRRASRAPAPGRVEGVADDRPRRARAGPAVAGGRCGTTARRSGRPGVASALVLVPTGDRWTAASASRFLDGSFRSWPVGVARVEVQACAGCVKLPLATGTPSRSCSCPRASRRLPEPRRCSRTAPTLRPTTRSPGCRPGSSRSPKCSRTRGARGCAGRAAAWYSPTRPCTTRTPQDGAGRSSRARTSPSYAASTKSPWREPTATRCVRPNTAQSTRPRRPSAPRTTRRSATCPAIRHGVSARRA